MIYPSNPLPAIVTTRMITVSNLKGNPYKFFLGQNEVIHIKNNQVP